MSEEEPDYSQLPLDERLVHKVWKVRKGAYEELDTEFQNSASEGAECFQLWLRNPELVRKAVTDNNVVSQEAAISALVSFLQYGGVSASNRTLNSVVPALCDKALSSSRTKTKQKSIDALLWYTELGTAGPVIELIIPSLSARSPRSVASAVSALNEIYKSFGCKVCPPKLALEQLPKLFGHADRKVREEAVQLSVTLRSYMGEAFEALIFPSLKPIQQKDLSKAFSKIEGGVPTPTRLLRSQQIRQQQLQEQQAGAAEGVDIEGGDIEMKDADSEESKPIDPYDLAEPVRVLANLPSDFIQRVSDPKWKERVAVLEEVQKAFDVLRIKNEDFSDFVRILSKCLADANLQVVTLTAQTILELANGLRRDFERYVSSLIGPLLERTKEKKKSVSDALNAALDACFKYSAFSEICEPAVRYMSHKTPQIKIETCKFLVRCLKEVPRPPSKPHIDSIMTTAIHLLDDSQVQVRSAASEVIATMMKILGERASKPYVSKIEHRHMKKIEDIYANTEVKAKSSSPKPVDSEVSKRTLGSRRSNQSSRISSSHSSSKRPAIGGVPSLRKPDVPSASSSSSSMIPAKRGGSPIKMTTNTSKMNLNSRSLRSVNESNSVQSNPAERRELEDLRKEKERWLKEREQLESSLQQQIAINEKSVTKIESLSSTVEDFKAKFASLSVASKSKDTQLKRLQSDLEAAKAKISAFENSTIQRDPRMSMLPNFDLKSPVRSPPADVGFNGANAASSTSDANSSLELNRRISGLSIQPTSEKENLYEGSNSTTSKLASGLYELDSNDDSWKRAAEVTNQLKARIEQMKARTRTLSQM
ncbi:DEKNAAC102332 [Brettanomyces naardenensis]|uniref:DEKNAAC102332 n=1 Tax=Brettanomyces naardenensis TaxID=13370 RepID=A0A448YL96_BRENA|nr:DEKNAAC102332 [Brettanomyces naardenensis]